MRFQAASAGVRALAGFVFLAAGLAACAAPADPATSGASAVAAVAPRGTWAPKAPPLATAWTAQVSPENALPEYPRPQLARDEWLNLNGVWEFAPASGEAAPPFGQTLPERILVPFPVESALSGVQRSEQRMWYRRSFSVPAEWLSRRVRLHFGAVDWQATVYLNRQEVASHQGGYTGFSADISGPLHAGENELLVAVFDPTDAGGQPIGKQRLAPEGIFYTAASGIWQTVWLEPTSEAFVESLSMTPDLEGQALLLTVAGEPVQGETVEASARDGGTLVGTASGELGSELRLPVPDAKPWSPDQPFLYDLEVTLKRGDRVVDRVTSYFGMRSIEVAESGGRLRLLLNGEFVFQLGTLDQGYWPDGIYTAPTDEALRSDIQKHKDLGFNLIRKHVKVEPQRWYYWADRIGLLVWQDMPSMNNTRVPSPGARTGFEAELRELVEQYRNAPSIVMWVPFNEGWGQYDLARIADLVKQWDPSRLVNNNSGINCCESQDGGNGDVADWHVYVGPGNPSTQTERALVLGEFGGLGLAVAEHVWRPGDQFSYGDQSDAAALTNQYAVLMARVRDLIGDAGLSAAVYTQLTDVETEVNGLLTYDRAVTKIDQGELRAAHQRVLDAARNLD